MGKGRKPVPTELHILRGNPGKRKRNTKAPKPSKGSVEPPEWLRAEAKRAWFILAPEFSTQGILTKSDVPALAAFCSAWGDFVNADRALETEGDMEYVTTKSGVMKKENPWHYVKARALQQCDKYAAQFGVGASYRAKLTIDGEEKEDEFSKWKKGVKK